MQHHLLSPELQGVEEMMSSGTLAGFPVVDVTATLHDGSFHDVDSSVLAFQIAARMAFREGMRKGAVRLLEPIMKVSWLFVLLTAGHRPPSNWGLSLTPHIDVVSEASCLCYWLPVSCIVKSNFNSVTPTPPLMGFQVLQVATACM